MAAGESSAEGLFYVVAASGARALLIGHKALVVLGVPVVAGEYEYWIHADDVETFNRALSPLGFVFNCTLDAARSRDCYALEKDERIVVRAASVQLTVDGARVAFDEVWSRRVSFPLDARVSVELPCLDDLIATKRFAARPKDAEDIRMLEALRRRAP
ncbi:MAG TPA: hypothetical protein VFF06_11925 [Polyangia bacterium]|nr:hypothetical protein [Polyangia bacterium]